MRKSNFTSIRDTLDGSKAIQQDFCVLNQDLSLARWANQQDRVKYQKVGHHTLSLYLSGGHDTQRLDLPAAGRGSPGKLCLMPATQDSEWGIGTAQEFIHFYISDAAFKFFALESFDIDSRLVNLPDLTFVDHPQLSRLCHSVIQSPWHDVSEHLQLQQAFYEVMGCLIQEFVSGRSVVGSLKGGLSRRQLKIIVDYVDAHAALALPLECLAEVCGLSPFHFARMFKQSTGLTPHQYVTKVRTRKAMAMLKDGVSQIDAALACGFSHQSHFAAHFKREFGISPARLMREL